MTYTPSTTAIADNLALTALAGLLPLLVFFVLLGVFKVATHWCAIISLVTALVVAMVGFGMPGKLALLAGTQGIAFGFMPILYIIIAAVWLYNLTEVSGRSADVRAVFNVVGKGDMRVQAVLLAFSFCGLLEGLAGFGAPVAIVAAILVTVGFPPIKAAVLTVVGNAINVGFGGMGIPVTTSGALGRQSPELVGAIMGHYTPFIAILVPFVLLSIADGIRGIRQCWPIALAAGLAVSTGHVLAATYFSYQLTAVVASLLGFAAIALVLKFWSPTTPEDQASEPLKEKLPASRAMLGLLPYALVIAVFGVAKLWKIGVDLPAALASTDVKIQWPGLYGNLLTSTGEASTSPIFNFQWLSSPGTMISLTALVICAVYASTSSGGLYPMTFGKGVATLGKTIVDLRISILTIATVMGLAYVMNMSGQTTAIGTWLAGTGAAFALLSPVLGWLGTAVTGSATSANALFADLQATAAAKVGIDPSLLLASNTVGGGLGKIVSPQNLTVVATAINKPGSEAEVLAKVAKYSLGFLAILAIVVGLSSIGALDWWLPARP